MRLGCPAAHVRLTFKGKDREMDFAARLQRQRCKVCWNADGFNFHVPDEIWRAVVPPELQQLVVCLRCFDDFAHEKGIDYSGHLRTLYFAGEQVAFRFRWVP